MKLALSNMGRAALIAVLAAAAGLSAGTGIEAQERAVGTIWIDPDGCEHWVRDDGWEGYASNRLNRDGTPVCHKVETCGTMNTDVLFATDSARLNRHVRQSVANFFRKSGSRAYTIIGHTDSRASDSYNLRLSYNRANAIAKVAAQAGANVNDIRGYGERRPVASNQTAAGMQKNRRVEILCIR